MKLPLALAISLAPTLALAQEKLTLSLLPPEIQVIGACLGKQPFADVAGLMANLQQQVSAQQQAKVAATEAPKEK